MEEQHDLSRTARSRPYGGRPARFPGCGTRCCRPAAAGAPTLSRRRDTALGRERAVTRWGRAQSAGARSGDKEQPKHEADLLRPLLKIQVRGAFHQNVGHSGATHRSQGAQEADLCKSVHAPQPSSEGDDKSHCCEPIGRLRDRLRNAEAGQPPVVHQQNIVNQKVRNDNISILCLSLKTRSIIRDYRKSNL